MDMPVSFDIKSVSPTTVGTSGKQSRPRHDCLIATYVRQRGAFTLWTARALHLLAVIL